MDPTAALKSLRAALAENDHDEAHWLARNLLNWIGQGGFAPRGETVTSTLGLCHSVLSRVEKDLVKP